MLDFYGMNPNNYEGYNMIDTSIIAMLSTACLLFITIHLNRRYNNAITKLKQISSLLETITNAVDDDKITKEEIQQIINQCQSIINEGKDGK